MERKIKTLPVSEENYAETMREKVEPYLASLRKDDTFKSYDGNAIHYEMYLKDGAVGNMVVVHGFTESAEKFREMAYNFLCMDLNVFVIDNRGHGHSFRYNPEDPETVSIRHFEEYVRDLNFFLGRVVIPNGNGLPLYLYAHSMGGAIAVQHLQTWPGVFEKAILSAPMILAQSGPVSPQMTERIMNMFIAMGKGEKRVFIHKGYNPDYAFEDSHDTSRARFEYYNEKRRKNRHLQTASASNYWVREAMKVAKKNLDPKRCAGITAKVLLFQPETDKSVVSEKEDEFIAMVPDGRLVQLPDCKHEIYASVDSTVLQYLQIMEAFLFDEKD